MDNKIKHAEGLIKQVMGKYRSPVLMSSFGKDSMVMLSIASRMGLNLPVLFHREPFSPLKYQFANHVIEEMGLTVYDYPPSATQIVKNGGTMEIVGRYQAGEKKYTWVPTGIKKPTDGEPFLCGYCDLYVKPFGTFNFPWDVAFVGHKSTDVDPIFGAIPLSVDIKINDGGCDFAYPLRYFSDADVWEYTERFNVPYNDRRYDKENGYREFEDVTFNNDYHIACARCIDRDEPAVVECPKLGRTISNISSEVRYVNPERPAYLDGVENGRRG